MPSKPRYYWDACAWIALIKREPNRFDACKHVIDLAEAGQAEIWTSAFTLAEVFKRNSDTGIVSLEANKDIEFEDYIEKEFVIKVQVDTDVGTAARRLLRTHPEIGKPQDAIHVATALLYDIDELHTFDRKDLLALNGVLDRADGKKLSICPPPNPPPPPKKPEPLPSLFDHLEKPSDAKSKREAEG